MQRVLKNLKRIPRRLLSAVVANIQRIFCYVGILSSMAAGAPAPDRVSIESARAAGIPLATAAGGSVTEQVTLHGHVELHPGKAQHLHPKMAGLVRSVQKTTGESVRAGESLARIENAMGTILDVSPEISGVVLERRIAAGQSVSPETNAFTVADLSVLQANLIANPRDLHRLAIGQVVALAGAADDCHATAPLSYIAPFLDSATRTARVTVTFENADGSWRVGEAVVAKVAAGTVEVRIRLAAALAEGGDLYVRRGDEFLRTNLKLGRSDDQGTEVLSGLNAGSEYLAEPVVAVAAKLAAAEAKAESAQESPASGAEETHAPKP